ncbi:hypothetical protein A0H81_00171 [Grifola frondosa]|uniref:Uncharacterized protein n=1 Tax=Grifola frondosa TaxID=5627 RepID=A0A1C7MW55_GRIFR|nr:hypothetical protein A0H81_00171 [Grifola frondosa]
MLVVHAQYQRYMECPTIRRGNVVSACPRPIVRTVAKLFLLPHGPLQPDCLRELRTGYINRSALTLFLR